MCLTDLTGILHSLISRVKACAPSSKHYIGNLPENYTPPCFLYLPVFIGEGRSSYFTKKRKVDLQVVYFGLADGYGTQDMEDKLATMESLSPFLDTFCLDVSDRNLKFDYSFTEADSHLAISITFSFTDGVVNPKLDEEQARELIENININLKES